MVMLQPLDKMMPKNNASHFFVLLIYDHKICHFLKISEKMNINSVYKSVFKQAVWSAHIPNSINESPYTIISIINNFVMLRLFFSFFCTDFKNNVISFKR